MRHKQESDGLHTAGVHASGSGKPGYHRIMSLHSLFHPAVRTKFNCRVYEKPSLETPLPESF
jgi:hypothetical protein